MGCSYHNLIYIPFIIIISKKVFKEIELKKHIIGNRNEESVAI